MTTFQGSDFQIDLPAEFSDESTYVFAFPARSQFRPSVVIKTERLAAPVQLADYVERQLATIGGQLPNLSIVSNMPLAHADLTSHQSVFDWGDAARRVRQKQRYLLLQDPLRVVTLTATHLQESFAPAEVLFDAVFASFKPSGRA